MAVDVIKEESDLLRERWSFSVVSNYSDLITMRLTVYATEQRESKRHKWKPIKKWESMQEWHPGNLKREQVTIPDWVKQRARELVEIDVPDLEPRKEGKW